MEEKNLTAVLRKELKKGASHQLRKEGKIPAVIYGHNPTVSVALDEKLFHKRFRDIEDNIIYRIDVEGDRRDVLVKDLQEDIISGKILHIDFYEIEKGKALRTTVPIKITGVSPAVKEGGILEEHIHSLEVECIPTAIPAFIEVDVSELKMGESIHVGQVPVPPEVKILTSEDQSIVGVNLPRAAAAETQEEGAPEAAADAAEG